jgi:hypothetical protein
MKPQVIITKTKNGISISSPFSHSNNAVFRSKGGVWNPETKCWDLPNTTATLEMIEQLFGAVSPLTRVRIPANAVTEEGNQWKVGGHVVGHRQHSDSPVAMPPGVQVEKGEWKKHGGTAAEPRVTGSDDLVVTAVVHRSFAEREGLEVISAEEDAVWNPLADRSIEELEDELKRRKAENKESLNDKEKSAIC